MSKNTSPTQLDSAQLIKRVYDEDNDAFRVEIGAGTSFAISISADSGDSVVSVPNVSQSTASPTNASIGVVVPASSCIGMKSFNLYTKTTATIFTTQACTLEVSPSDTEDVWITTSSTITPSHVTGIVVMGAVTSSIVARRARVSMANSISSGSFDIYLVSMAV